MLPLDGLKVLDLSRLLPGGYATMVLADLGADVLKVEEPGRGDYVRWMPPYAGGQSAGHLALNRGKRSLTLDLKRGSDVFLELAAGADVVVESFRPGVMDRLGVGYEAVREVNRGIVYAAISGYGATGPYADKAGHDVDYLAYAGVLSFSDLPGVQVGDLGGGAWPALVAILVALRVREQTGEGQFCDVSMTDGALSWSSIHAAGFFATGVPPRRGAEVLNGGAAWYGVYECGDGKRVAVGALEPQFFRALLAGLGLEELEPLHADFARHGELRAALMHAFASKPRDEWVAVFDGVDACVAPVNDLAEAVADPQVVARGMVSPVVLPDGTPFSQLGVVPRLGSTPGRVGGVAPGLGEHTDEVLAALGRTAEEIAALREAGVV